MDNSKPDFKHEQLIELLVVKLTHSDDLVQKLTLRSGKEGFSLPKYQERYDSANDLVSGLASDLFEASSKTISKEHLISLIWFILLLPLGEATEFEGYFETIELKPLEKVFELIFKNLIKQGYKHRILLNSGGDLKTFEIFMFCVDWLEKKLIEKCNEKGYRRQKIRSGVYSFYVKASKSPYFEHFALSFPAYFNKKVINNLDLEIEKRRKNEKYTDYFYKLPKKEKDRLEIFPPHWKVEVTPTALMNDLLEIMEDVDIGDEAFAKEELIEEVKLFCAEQKFAGGTAYRKIVDLKIYFDASKEHLGLFGNIKRSDKRYTESYQDYVDPLDENADQKVELQANISGDLQSSDYYGGAAAFSNIQEENLEDFKGKFKKKLIKHKFYAHHKEGGVLWMVDNWANQRNITYPSVCAFLGFLNIKSKEGKKYRDLLECFKESFLTGAAVKKIIEYTEKDSFEPGEPIGLFLKPPNISCEFPLFKTVYNEFKKQSDTLKFSMPGFIRMIRAWHTDKMKCLTPVEMSHTCGSTLSGTRSDMFYILPERIIEDHEESSRFLLKRHLRYVNEYKTLGNSFSENESRYIDASAPVFAQMQRELELKSKARKKRWEANKPSISFTEIEKAKNIYKRLLKNLQVASANTEEFVGACRFSTDAFDVKSFKGKYTNECNIVNVIMIKNGIDINNLTTVTAEQLKNALNELLDIPNLVKLLDDKTGTLPEQAGAADKKTIIANKHKLLKKYPYIFQQTEFLIEVEKIVAFFLGILLLLRKGEIGRTKKRLISLIRHELLVEAKRNRAKKEIRSLHVPDILMKLIVEYLEFREIYDKRNPIIKTSKNEYLFREPKKILIGLNDDIWKPTGDVRDEVGSLRKYSATKVHNLIFKKQKLNFLLFQYIIGHYRPGFHQFSSFNYMSVNEIKSVLEEYSKSWEKEIGDVIEIIKNARKKRHY